MPSTANSLAGFLAVYAEKNLETFIANMPNINLFTKNFDSSISNGGVSVTTRIADTVWGTANDLSTNGWANTAASASSYTATIKERAFDTKFSELEWATITPQILTNLYMPVLAKQMANSIVVDAIGLVSSSYYTSTVTPDSSSTFTVTGSTSLQAAITTLSNNEQPEEGRYAIVSPAIHQTLMSGVLPTYVYGDSNIVKNNNAQNLLNCQLSKYPRFYGASKPYGGNFIGTSGGETGQTADKLVGMVGNSNGLICALRMPVDVNNGLVQSATAVDETSGLSLQTRIVYDVSVPVWRMAVVAVYGTARGSKYGIVPVITKSV